MTTTPKAKKTYPDNSAILDAAEDFFDALDRNASDAEIRTILKRIPISPQKALSLKKFYGKDFLIAEEANLSLADAAFGEGWLDE